jgi:hypothetical protein
MQCNLKVAQTQEFRAQPIQTAVIKRFLLAVGVSTLAENNAKTINKAQTT